MSLSYFFWALSLSFADSFLVLLMFYQYVDFHINKIKPSAHTILDKRIFNKINFSYCYLSGPSLHTP